MNELPELTRFFHPILPARQLRKKPMAVQIGGQRYALWRDATGRPCAVLDACPHRQASLSRGRVRPDGRLACGYHGWNFDGTGCGQSPSQPKLKCDTASYQVVERHGYLWLASRSTPVDALPELGWEGYELAGAFSTLMPAPIHIMLDNFTEDEHFPYVHSIFGWTEDKWPEVQFEAKTENDRTSSTYVGPQRASVMLPLVGVTKGDLFYNSIESRFDPVRHVYSSHWTQPKTGKKRALEAKTVVFMAPETDASTRFHTFIFIRIAKGSPFRLIRPVMRFIARTFVKLEWWMDSRWVRFIAETAPDLRGLRLGKFDKSLIRNRKLLRTIYYGEADAAADRRAS